MLFVSGAALASPDFLVVAKGDGTYGPGAAVSWSTEAGDAGGAGTIVFKLAAGVDAAQIAQTLTDRMSTAKVELQGDTLRISGLAEATLLDQLSTLSLSGEVDPLAALAGLSGDAVAMDVPEAGGSIRASKPMGGGAAPKAIAKHDPKERLVARVVEVERGTFPEVKLKLKIRKAPATAGNKELAIGNVITAKVLLGRGQGGVDFANGATQTNLGAYYLQPGDMIAAHVVAGGEGATVDWVQRQNAEK